MSVKVSVIVPIYNVEKYLKKSLHSLKHQTLKDIEVILVNDGSTDHSQEIAEKYVKSTPTFKLINKPNGGLSSARNAGMDIACGEYLAFVDSDDWVAFDMMEKLYDNAKKYDSDMVLSGFYRAYSGGKNLEKFLMSEFEEVYQKEQVYRGILLPMLGNTPEAERDIQLDMCVWKNIYRRELIEKNKIRFKSERIYLSEDIVFHMELLPLVNTASVVDECFYYYRLNPMSLTQSFREDIYEKQFSLYHHLKEMLQERGYWDDAEFRLKRLFIGRIRNKLSNDIAYADISVFQKWKIARDIMTNKNLKELFKDYPVHKYKGKLLISVIPLKYSLTVIFMILSILGKR